MLFPCLLINIFRVIVVHLDDTIMVFGSKNNILFFAGKAFPLKTDGKKSLPTCGNKWGRAEKKLPLVFPTAKAYFPPSQSAR